jgi:antitoxin CcdA
MGSVTVSVRIPRELKDKVDRYGVKISEVVRRALEEEVRRRELEEVLKAAEELGDLLSRISEEEILSTIREVREGR